MFRRVMNGEARPQPVALALAESAGQRLGPVGVEIVHHQMNGAGRRIRSGDPPERPGELWCIAVASDMGVMAAVVWFYKAEHVSGPMAHVFVVLACTSTRRQRHPRPLRSQRLHRSFVQRHQRRALVNGLAQNVQPLLHPRDVFLVQLRHTSHFFRATA